MPTTPALTSKSGSKQDQKSSQNLRSLSGTSYQGLWEVLGRKEWNQHSWLITSRRFSKTEVGLWKPRTGQEGRRERENTQNNNGLLIICPIWCPLKSSRIRITMGLSGRQLFQKGQYGRWTLSHFGKEQGRNRSRHSYFCVFFIPWLTLEISLVFGWIMGKDSVVCK